VSQIRITVYFLTVSLLGVAGYFTMGTSDRLTDRSRAENKTSIGRSADKNRCWSILSDPTSGDFSGEAIQSPPVKEVSFESWTKLRSFYENRSLELRDLYGETYIIVESFPDNFDEIRRIRLKKQLFQNILVPIVRIENQRVQYLRLHLVSLRNRFKNSQLSNEQMKCVRRYLVHYEVYENRESIESVRPGDFERLFKRVQVIPSSLVLAQAAHESGWGSSRFAREVNNIFGEWTYDESEGIKPSAVDESVDYRVKSFSNIRASVRSYMHNLNTHYAYRRFRNIRAEQTDNLDSLKLAQTLEKYSTRREDYVESITALIRSNNYRRFDNYD